MDAKQHPFLSLIPFLVFLTLYMGAGIWFSYQGTEYAFYQFPATSCALIGFIVSLLLNFKELDRHIETFISGIGDKNVVLMSLIFLLSGAFSVLTQNIGSVDHSVNMGIAFLPSSALLPGVFLISCLISFAMGSAMGTISTLIPIALGIATKTHSSIPLIVGSVVGGSMFGDNLSIISDTSVAAATSLNCTAREKLWNNFKIAFPASVLVLTALFFAGKTSSIDANVDFSFYKTLPYLIVIALAITGMNVVAVLSLGIASATFIGFTSNSLTVITLGKSLHEGFESMSEVFFLTLLSAGLAAIVTQKGGLQYLLSKLEKRIHSKRSAELGIASLASLADICIANNTVAIIVTGPIVKKIAETYKIEKQRAASLVDIFTCVWQGIIPFGAQILLAGGLAKLSPFHIIPYTWYPIVLGVLAFVSMLCTKESDPNEH